MLLLLLFAAGNCDFGIEIDAVERFIVDVTQMLGFVIAAGEQILQR